MPREWRPYPLGRGRASEESSAELLRVQGPRRTRRAWLRAPSWWARLGLPERVIAAQMGWSLDETGEAIKALLAVYGHGEIGALEAVDRVFETAEVVPIRGVQVAGQTHAS